MDRLGYDMLCLFFDTQPAGYVGIVCYTFAAYLGLLHLHFKIARLAKSIF